MTCTRAACIVALLLLGIPGGAIAGPGAGLERTVFDGSYGVGFRDQLFAFEGALHHRPILEEMVRLRLTGPVGSWKILRLGVSGELRNEDLLGQGEPSGATSLAVRGDLSLLPVSVVPIRAWGGLRWMGSRGSAWAFGRALDLDAGADVRLHLPRKAPQISARAWVADSRRGAALDTPANSSLMTDLEVDVVQNAGPLRATAGYRRQAFTDRLDGRSSVRDSWGVQSSLRAHRRLRISLGGGVQRFLSGDVDGQLARLLGARASARLAWHPSSGVWNTTFYRYRRDRVDDVHRTTHAVGSDVSIQLRDGIWAGAVVGLDQADTAEGDNRRSSLSEQQLVRVEAFRQGRVARGRLSGHAGFGYVVPEQGQEGFRGLAGVRAAGAVFPLRALSLHAEGSFDRIDDRSALDMDLDRLGAGAGIGLHALRQVIFDGLYRAAWIAGTDQREALTSHDLDLRASAAPARWLRLAALGELAWILEGEGVSRQALAGGTAALHLGRLAWIEGTLRYGDFRLSDGAVHRDVEAMAGVTIRIRRWTLAALLRSRYEVQPVARTHHSVSVHLTHDFRLVR